MRTLFLVRHAKSSWANPGLRDIDRPLNSRGLRDAPQMGALLFESGVRPDLLVASPAKRALTTAQIFAGIFGMTDEDIIREPRVYEASVNEILRIITALSDSAQTVMLFGHNPTFTDVVNRFTSEPIINVPTCGVVQINSSASTWAAFDEGNAQVHACFFPKEVL